MFRRGFIGTYHCVSDKRLQRRVDEFTSRQCVRENTTETQMGEVVARMVGKRLLHKDLCGLIRTRPGARNNVEFY